jgi:hypothetical protein
MGVEINSLYKEPVKNNDDYVYVTFITYISIRV